MAFLRLKYNAPLTLSYTGISLVVLLLGYTINGGKNAVIYPFTVGGDLDLLSVSQWFRLFSHAFGHQDFTHFFRNFTLLLLLGPLLEEKYGAKKLLIYTLITAFITGLFQTILFDTYLLGASGTVFLFIVLSSMSNFKKGEIPITFVLIIFIYLGNELLMASMPTDSGISHYAHIVGGVCGAVFGLADKKVA